MTKIVRQAAICHREAVVTPRSRAVTFALMDLTTEAGRAAWREWERERWEAVETMKAKELAAMSDEQAWQIIQRLIPFDAVPPKNSNGQGLVQQQALFHRLAE
jgi:hypothetical protein